MASEAASLRLQTSIDLEIRPLSISGRNLGYRQRPSDVKRRVVVTNPITSYRIVKRGHHVANLSLRRQSLKAMGKSNWHVKLTTVADAKLITFPLQVAWRGGP